MSALEAHYYHALLGLEGTLYDFDPTIVFDYFSFLDDEFVPSPSDREVENLLQVLWKFGAVMVRVETPFIENGKVGTLSERVGSSGLTNLSIEAVDILERGITRYSDPLQGLSEDWTYNSSPYSFIQSSEHTLEEIMWRQPFADLSLVQKHILVSVFEEKNENTAGQVWGFVHRYPAHKRVSETENSKRVSKVPFTVSYVFPHKIGRFLQGQIIKKPGMMEKLSTLVVAQMARELDQDSGEKQFTFEDRGAERTSLLHSIIRDFGPSAAQHPWGLLHFSREQAPVDEDVR
ncbi:hypothetical protein LRY58_02900 [Candidatus Woesebacteria bacterium]|nr:hypothetical protein [Candidatus Woesebacteria bacterium]